MPTLAFIHTVPGLIATFDQLAEQYLPESWSHFSILDQSLLANTIREGAPSSMTLRRLSDHVFSAVDGEADAVVVTCSTLGECTDRIAPISPVPLFRIDTGMALAAIGAGRRIGILATLPTTMAPTRRLLENTSAQLGKETELVERMCEGAFDRLEDGDRQAHDELVRAGFEELSGKVDVVVLAQASMADALSGEAAPGRPSVLTSPELGLKHVARELSREPGQQR